MQTDLAQKLVVKTTVQQILRKRFRNEMNIKYPMQLTISVTGSTPSVTYKVKGPGAQENGKQTLTLNLHEELYVISSADSKGALETYDAIIRALLTTTAAILASYF